MKFIVSLNIFNSELMRSGACHADNFNRLHLSRFIFCKKINQCSCYNIVYTGHFIVILCISSQADKDNDKDNDNCFSSGLSCFSGVDKVCKLLTWLLMQQPSKPSLKSQIGATKYFNLIPNIPTWGNMKC